MRTSGCEAKASLFCCCSDAILDSKQPNICQDRLGTNIGTVGERRCVSHTGAAYHELLASEAVKPGELVVVVLTGTGIKATPKVAELLGVEL